jgi:NTE family protein
MTAASADHDRATPRRVALALGSGGARGYAHIGVVEVLTQRGYDIVAVAGSSMGALVGGLHAAGVLDEYAAWSRGLSQHDVMRYLDPGDDGPGAIRAEKILTRVFELIGDTLIEDLPVPFTAVTTDLLAGREIWLQEGPLGRAIRASIAIPGVIAPAMVNGRLLVDGGIVNPVPVSATASARADLVVAVSLNGDRRPPFEAPARETSARQPVDAWLARLRAGAAQFLDPEAVETLVARVAHRAAGLPPHAQPQLEGLPEQLGKLDVMNLSLNAMQSLLSRYRLAVFIPDVLITVPRQACRTADFHRAAELIDLGRRLAEEALDALPANGA